VIFVNHDQEPPIEEEGTEKEGKGEKKGETIGRDQS
jgi:hypothetical protein